MSAQLLTYAEADAVVASYARTCTATRARERIELIHAAGRVLAEPVVADNDQPSFPRSTRDGFACRAVEASAHAWLRIAGTIHAGEAPAGPLPSGAAWEIMTGAPVPEGADAVVMVEHIEQERDSVRLAQPRSIASGDNVVARGAQARRGEELTSAGIVIGPAQIALAASCGYAHLSVFRRPRVAILTTGDELVPVDQAPAPGQIRNSNAPMLASLVARAGGEPHVLAPVSDTAEALDEALRTALDADLLVISGGVSAGKFDLVEPALAHRGATFRFTGVRIQPGKPLVFGEVPRKTAPALPFFGLPGNPISSAATFLLFATHVLAALAGRNNGGPQFFAAQLSQATDRKAKPGLTRFLPALCTFHRGETIPQVATIPWHGSGDLPAFARANCFVVVPQDAGTLEAGTVVRILMF
ncbi:MAG TPA: gephyrin-like molybdotransferase Glp [Terracidiphilus sp.]|jgi:molybdopterin molybdotransferase|nr:gephyrin-like molybdotransferase Glp [Terracidiphilus sp.]